MGVVIPYAAPRQNMKGRVCTCPEPTCRYVSVVPPDYPGEPICPRCLWRENAPPRPQRNWHRLALRVAGVLGLCGSALALGIAFGLLCARICPN